MFADKPQSALDIIFDLTLELKSVEDISTIRAGLDEIQAIARYGFDVRAIESAEDMA